MNLTVLIGSCDKYEPLWETFQISFDKYWNINTENLIVTETKQVPQYTETNIKTVAVTGKWGKRILKAIEEIDTDWIFFILEDYFFKYTYTEGQLIRYLQFCDKMKVDRLQIAPSKLQTYTTEVVDGYTKFARTSDYQVSIQPSIWSKSFIKQTLKPTYSPWDYELKGSAELKHENSQIYIDTKVPRVYFNALRKGMVKNTGWNDYFKQQKIKEPII